MDQTQPDRPPLAERLRAGLEEAVEWAKGDRSLRTTEITDGERVVRHETGAEWAARHSLPNAEMTEDVETLVASYLRLSAEQRAEVLELVHRLENAA